MCVCIYNIYTVTCQHLNILQDVAIEGNWVTQMVKASACNAGDPGLIPGWGRSSGEGNGNPLQYSCLENSTDGGAWWATVHGVAKGRTRLSHFPERGKRYMGSLSIMFYRCEIEFHFKREWVHSCLQGVLLCSE